MSSHAPRALGEQGLQRAMERLEADLRDGRCPLVSLAEVLSWLDGLARWHRDVLGARDYDTRRHDDADGRTLAGVRYAYATVERDATRMGQLAKFGGPGPQPPGLEPLSGLLAGRSWRWRRAEALPPPTADDEATRPEAATCYDHRVAKHPLTPPLWAATRFLAPTVSQGAGAA